MEQIWLTWAKQLQAIASTGMHFTDGQYDRERYEQIADISQQMLSRLGDVPIERVLSLFPDSAQGYATPKVDVRGAVIQNDKILLVKERVDQLWTLPGGYADVGLSPAENVAKEVDEEASITVEVKALYALRHKARHGYDQDARDFYKFFFLCEQTDERFPAPGPETMDAVYFSADELPPLSRTRVIEEDIHAAFGARSRETVFTLFD